MRRHQILTGAVNPGNHCFSVGSIASFTFWAYGSGCDLVILGVDLQPIHVIPGHVQGYKLISCIDCCQFCGKIAVSYGHHVIIYRPKLICSGNDGVPVFTWVEESTLKLDQKHGPATVLSWASSGEWLLIGCKEILLWGVIKEEARLKNLKVHFSIDEEDEAEYEANEPGEKPKEVKWELLWNSGIDENMKEVKFSPDDELFASISHADTMIKIWHRRTSLPPDLMADANAASVAASKSRTGKMSMASSNHINDHIGFKSPPTSSSTNLDFTFTFLIHPKPVVGFSWRKGVPLLPSGSVPNVLISSCHDNMCRVWCETLSPDTDIVKLAASQVGTHTKHHATKKSHTGYKDKGNQGLPVKKSVSAPVMVNNSGASTVNEENLPKSRHRLFRHFHIAATINPVADIPLLPSLSSLDLRTEDSEEEIPDECQSQVFTIHWLDNKYHRTMANLNQILHKAMSEASDLQKDDPGEFSVDADAPSPQNENIPLTKISPTHAISPRRRPSGFKGKFPVWDSKNPEAVDTYLSCLMSPVSPEIQFNLGLSLPSNVYNLLKKGWLEQSDALFAIHPSDGSLLIWHINFLDENRCGRIRQAQVSFSCRIPMAIPARDASTLCSRILLYANYYSDYLSFSDNAANASVSSQKSDGANPNGLSDQSPPGTDGPASPMICMLSKHTDGCLNHWAMSFSSTSSYSTITSITHKARFCGHRYHLSSICCHPTLPLLLTTAHHKAPVPKKEPARSHEFDRSQSKVKSELILWRVDPVGTLCCTGGVTELARLNGASEFDFTKISWFPILFPSWCLGPSNTSPSSCFLTMNKSCIRIYQAVIDAEKLLDFLDVAGEPGCSNEGKLGQVASRQSSSHPGCCLLLETITLNEDITNVDEEMLLLHVFPEDQFVSEIDPSHQDTEIHTEKGVKRFHGIAENFYIVLMLKSSTEECRQKSIVIRTWKISFTANLLSVSEVRARRNTAAIISDSSEYGSDTQDVKESDSKITDDRLSFVNVRYSTMPSQSLHHQPDTDIILACASCDPLTLSLFNNTQALPFTILTTADSGQIFFWRCKKKAQNRSNSSEALEWVIWDGDLSCDTVQKAPTISDLRPHIEVKGTPLVVKMAHCCMLACLYRSVSEKNQNLCYIAVYECVSSGGSQWRIQDVIRVGTITSTSYRPSNSAVSHLDWLSCEDGSFLLTVNVGKKVKIYSQCPEGMQWEEICGSFINEDRTAGSRQETARRKHTLLKRQSTLDMITRQKLFGQTSFQSFGDGTKQSECLLHWSLLSEISLGNSLGLSSTAGNHRDQSESPDPLAVTVSWVRDGLLLVATETEMHVYCHWVDQGGGDNKTTGGSGVLYGSASLSHSTPQGLCQFLMQDESVATSGQADPDTVNPAKSLMSVANMLCPTLPQYHPLVLSELTNGGHLDMVKHILVNLARMMNGQLDMPDGVILTEPVKLKKFGLTVEDSHQLEKKQITPLLLFDILDEDGRINDKMLSTTNVSHEKKSVNQAVGTSKSSEAKTNDYNNLFTSPDVEFGEDDLDLMLDTNPKDESTESIDLAIFESGYLGPEHCQVLHNYLSRNLLPGLTGLDQMELMAIADTVANAVDVAAFRSSEEKKSGGIGVDSGGRGYAASGNVTTESMDQCGLRFIFALHNHQCLLRSLPAQQRTTLLLQGLGTCHFAWAFHSDAEEEMLSLIPSIQRGSPQWEELTSFGAGWWIRSTPTLRRLVEQTARAAFLKDNNPLDAAIFYMALNKKNVLKGLFKSIHNTKMMQFFAQDFTEDRWHRAALKNAFALMGKQRFKEAAAFFLLANSIQDAVEVCIEKLSDLQLASIIVRLYNPEKSSESHSLFLSQNVLGKNDSSGEAAENTKKKNPDPFVRSMAYWALGSYEDALKTLLEDHRSVNETRNCPPINITDIFNFYNFLRTHPLITRKKRIDQVKNVGNTEQQLDDSITLEERMLFFATAAKHLEAGCPLLTLDVLSSLPCLRANEDDASEIGSMEVGASQDNTVNLQEPTDFVVADPSHASPDWGAPSALDDNPDQEVGFDLQWSESEESDGEEEIETQRPMEQKPSVKVLSPSPVQRVVEEEKIREKAESRKPVDTDVFANQLRLMACLKIFVSELKSIATTYRAGAGEQIRAQLYSWLEKETDVLRRISPLSGEHIHDRGYSHNSKSQTAEDKSEFSSDSESGGIQIKESGSFRTVPSLHELYMAEKQDWKQRRELASHRRKWLRQYRRFLRTLLSYCSLHDDALGSLSPLRMELLLLLQDSLQERTPQQLCSPLPNPTSVPLLSSSVVACRTVVADPFSRLTHMANDILSTMLSLPDPPFYMGWNQLDTSTIMLCRQAEALSLCLHQSLCDTQSRTYRARLLGGDQRKFDVGKGTPICSSQQNSTSSSVSTYNPPNTQPSQWPGVASLQSLLNSDSGDNRPGLIVLLCESMVAVYVSLLLHGLQTCNTLLLYRLINHPPCDKMWNAVFGGGAKVIVKYSKPSVLDKDVDRSAGKEDSNTFGSPSSWNDGSKVREKLNRRLLPHSLERRSSIGSSASNDGGTYREKFVAPETTLWDWFLSKPLSTPSGLEDIDFDSSDCSSLDDADLDEFGEVKLPAESQNTEHGDPSSYSWHILRLVIVKTILENLKFFLPTTGLELSELGTTSPILNGILEHLNEWQKFYGSALESFAEPPSNYIAGIQSLATSSRARPAILKYQAMLNPKNTPFIDNSLECLAAKRLWHCLVRREQLQDIFIRYIFQKKPRSESKGNKAVGKVKILHKESEIISSFCMNNANPNCVVISTGRDVQEIDLTMLMASDSWSWIEEDISSSMLQYPSDESNKFISSPKDDDFLMVTRRNSSFSSPSGLGNQGKVPWTSAGQTGQGASVLLKRAFSGVRRMTSHPTLPYYLTGHHDGSIRMWEWGHQQQISLFRAAGQFPKVTNLHFSQLGNKIAAVDVDGYLTLWRVSSPRKPFLWHRCHDRTASDCCFLSSTSVLATTGLSATNRNIAIWDTLLPPRSMLVKDFIAHEGVGATCIGYAAQQRTLLVGGRDGKVSVFDLRRPDMQFHCFTAHDAPIKCIDVSFDEKIFVTGSVVGDVRVWSTQSHLLAYNLSGEHSRTSIFRNFGAGTMKVKTTHPGNRLLSCGADGTLKLCLLPFDPRDEFGNGDGAVGSRIEKLSLQKQVVKLAEAVRQQCLVY